MLQLRAIAENGEGNGVAIDQRLSHGSREFGVEFDHLDGEGDLVGDTLAGTMTVRKQFQVGNGIVMGVSIFVMDSLTGPQTTPDVLFHDVTMFKDFLTSQGNRVADHDQRIASTISSRDVSVRKPLIEGGGLVKRLAFTVAKLLFSVKVLAVRTTTHWVNFTTLQAGKLVLLFGVSAAAKVGTRHGAIQRVTAPLFPQRRNDAGLHGERVSALFAGKRQQGHSGSEPPVQTFILSLARPLAEAASAVLRLDRKGPVTIFARQLNRHGFVPSFNKMDFAMPGMFSQGEK
jgi:hypothetical protein